MTPKLSLFIRDNGRFRINPEMAGRLQRFVGWANQTDFRRLQEDGTSPDEYKARTEEFFGVGMKTHLATATIENFAVSLPSTPTRFVKVKTRSLLQCPAWHKGAGGKAWIFADEIVIE